MEETSFRWWRCTTLLQTVGHRVRRCRVAGQGTQRPFATSTSAWFSVRVLVLNQRPPPILTLPWTKFKALRPSDGSVAPAINTEGTCEACCVILSARQSVN